MKIIHPSILQLFNNNKQELYDDYMLKKIEENDEKYGYHGMRRNRHIKKILKGMYLQDSQQMENN